MTFFISLVQYYSLIDRWHRNWSLENTVLTKYYCPVGHWDWVEPGRLKHTSPWGEALWVGIGHQLQPMRRRQCQEHMRKSNRPACTRTAMGCGEGMLELGYIAAEQ